MSNSSGSHSGTGLLLPALTDLFEVRLTRARAALIHPPAIVFAMLVALTLTAATLVGYDMARGKTRNWLHIVGFAVVMTLTVHVIVDVEYPRLGMYSRRCSRSDAAGIATGNAVVR